MGIKKIFVGAASDIGNVKRVNQDRILIKVGEDDNGEFGLFLIADGMGGLSHGEVASSKVIDRFNKWWNNTLKVILKEKDDENLKTISITLNNLVNKVNKEIIDYSKELGERVGTTISVLFIYKNEYIIKHVGDSRVYKIEDKLFQLTEDHSWVAQQVRNGSISKEQARFHRKKNILTQCIGVKEELDIFQVKGKVKDHDVFLLCSDGFYNKLYDEEIVNYINKYKLDDNKSLQTITEKLICIVKDREEKDNISAVFLSVIKEENKNFLKRLSKYFV